MQAPAPLLITRLAAFTVQKRQQAQGGVAHPSLSPLEADWRAWTRALFPTYVTAGDGQAIPGHLHSAVRSPRMEDLERNQRVRLDAIRRQERAAENV
jgi:hypothetical protein